MNYIREVLSNNTLLHRDFRTRRGLIIVPFYLFSKINATLHITSSEHNDAAHDSNRSSLLVLSRARNSKSLLKKETFPDTHKICAQLLLLFNEHVRQHGDNKYKVS